MCRILFVPQDLEMVHTNFGADPTKRLGGDAKRRFCTFRDFARKIYRRKWAWPISRDSAGSTERVDVWFSISATFGSGVRGQNVNLPVIAPPSGGPVRMFLASERSGIGPSPPSDKSPPLTVRAAV